MKLIIAGGRDYANHRNSDGSPDSGRNYTDILRLHNIMQQLDAKFMYDEIVSGGAKGADQCGEAWARENNVPVKVFNADWDEYGRAAGPVRNTDMAMYADVLVAFWDGESRGTKDMIEKALMYGLEIHVYRY